MPSRDVCFVVAEKPFNFRVNKDTVVSIKGGYQPTEVSAEFAGKCARYSTRLKVFQTQREAAAEHQKQKDMKETAAKMQQLINEQQQ